MSSSSLVVEKATLGHKKGVRAISVDVYSGYDYLMPIYEQWVQTAEERPDLR